MTSFYGLSSNFLIPAMKINNKLISKKYHNILKNYASHHGHVSLSSCQIGDIHKAFVILHSQHILNNKWMGYKSKQHQYLSVFNPQIVDYSEQKEQGWQICGSYVGLQMLINRSVSIKCNYNDEFLKNKQNQIMNGFMSVLFQHQYDHVLGNDLIKKAIQINITNHALKQKYQQELNNYLQQYKESIQRDCKQKQQKQKKAQQNEQYRKLKRFITYSIIDKTKGK